MRFEDKVAAITGAGQGLGAGFAKAFAKEGAVAVLIGRTGGKLQAVAEEIRKAVSYTHLTLPTTSRV